MNTYIFLQQYWWFVVSLLGAILVFLLFVQGGNSLIFCLGKTEEQRCFFCIVSVVLQHELRRCLLAVDDNPVYFRVAGGQL